MQNVDETEFSEPFPNVPWEKVIKLRRKTKKLGKARCSRNE